jgi:hypothetical protein
VLEINIKLTNEKTILWGNEGILMSEILHAQMSVPLGNQRKKNTSKFRPLILVLCETKQIGFEKDFSNIQ